MNKKVQCRIKLQVQAGMANPSPPIGPALGQRGVNILEFCKNFNKQTEHLEHGLILPVVITVFYDRSFDFIIKSPPASVLLKKAAGIQSGACRPKKDKSVKITVDQIYKIAEMKSLDMTGSDLDAMFRSILGTALSIGLCLEES